MHYDAIVTREGKNFLIDFPDCPGCQTFAEREGDIEAVATEALEGWLETMLAERKLPPRPTKRHARSGADVIAVAVNPKLTISVQLRLLRDERGLSQKALAKAMGVSQQAVAKLEDPDGNPTLDTVLKLATALAVRVEILFVPTEPPIVLTERKIGAARRATAAAAPKRRAAKRARSTAKIVNARS